MEGYIGEVEVDVKDTEYKDYTSSDWALLWNFMYGGIDGAHHKDWVLDQMSRILNGTKVIIKIAKWENGHTEERFTLDTPSQAYLDWVTKCKAGEDEPDTYGYDEGIAP